MNMPPILPVPPQSPHARPVLQMQPHSRNYSSCVFQQDGLILLTVTFASGLVVSLSLPLYSSFCYLASCCVALDSLKVALVMTCDRRFVQLVTILCIQQRGGLYILGLSLPFLVRGASRQQLEPGTRLSVFSFFYFLLSCRKKEREKQIWNLAKCCRRHCLYVQKKLGLYNCVQYIHKTKARKNNIWGIGVIMFLFFSFYCVYRLLRILCGLVAGG